MIQICLSILFKTIYHEKTITYNPPAEFEHGKSSGPSMYVSTDTACAGLLVTVANTSIPHPDSIAWNEDGLIFSTSLPYTDTIRIAYAAPGLHSVKLYTFNSGSEDSVTKLIWVKRNPHPAMIDTGICGYRVNNVYLSYKWYYWC